MFTTILLQTQTPDSNSNSRLLTHTVLVVRGTWSALQCFFIREQRCVQSHTSVNRLSMGAKPGLRLRYLDWFCYVVCWAVATIYSMYIVGLLTVLPPKRRCYIVIHTSHTDNSIEISFPIPPPKKQAQKPT